MTNEQTHAGQEGPGSKIGPYKLLQQIGEGGFGFVYMAEQHEPLRRKVALKIVKPGMDTRDVIARFEAERQALALMDHPNIARVLDAGATDTGRPFFVMELVRGVSLTEYCDKNQLSTRERLELFSTICQAVQHAHQKGIIHRDLKPSNILVTLHDGKPVPKVIDFGVAKALNQQLTEKTLFTAYGQMVGTPQYMSPEQAEMSGLDVDTRSDIYSLGVMLYELLTGTTPLDRERLRSAVFAEIQRIIREEEPPKPSTRISTLGAEATSVAQHRSADPRRLRQELVGELDWIVMKSLEKDRSRRYASASSLVDDIQRFLQDEPVLACPPSTTYRVTKFARRNKAILATAGAVALALLAAAVLSTVMAVRAVHAERLAQESLASEIAARTEAEQAQAAEVTQRHSAETVRDRADAARRQATTETELAQAAERQAQANFEQARATVDQYLTTVSESQLLTIPGMQPLRQAMLDTALTFYERFVAERPQDPQLRAGLAAAYARLGRVQGELQRKDEGKEYYAKSQQLYEALLKEGQATSEVQHGLAEVYFWQGRCSQTVSLCQRRLAQDAADRKAQLLLANTFNTLAVDGTDNENPEGVLRLHRDAFRLRSALVAAEPTNAEYLGDLSSTVNNVGVLLAQRGSAREALAQYQRGVDFAERAFTAARYSVLYGRFLAIGRRNESGYLAQLGLADEAIAARRRVFEVWQRLAQDNPALPNLQAEVSKAYRDLANFQRHFGRDAEAAQTVLQSRQLLENLPQETADDVYNLAVLYATLAGDAVPGDSATVAGPAAEDLRTAVCTLARAATLGYRNRAVVEKEPAFTALKQRPEFQTVLALLELREQVDATAKDPSKRAAMGALRHELEPLSTKPLAALLVAETLRTIGDYLMRAGDVDAAQSHCQRALELLRGMASATETPDVTLAVETARTWQLLGQIHFRAQRYADALSAWRSARAALNRVREGRQDDERLTKAVSALEYELADAYGTLGAFSGAREHFDSAFSAATEMPTGNSHIALQHAAILVHENDTAACQRLVNWMQTTYGETNGWHVVRFVIAECLAPTADTSGRNLVASMVKTLQTDPQNAWFQVGLGLAYLRRGVPALAVATFSQTATAHWIPGHYHTALAFHAQGDVVRAREHFEWGEARYRRALAKDVLLDAHPALPSNVQGTRFGGAVAHGWWEVVAAQIARAEASAAIEGQPRSDPWKHLLAARGFGLLGDAERATAEFASAEQASGDDPEAWVVTGWVHARLGDHAAAEEAFQQAIDLDPQKASTWIARGRYFAERGAANKAESDFTHAASLTPDELHQFLEAGWWVLGPIPQQQVSTAVSAALAGDPARPQTVTDTAPGRPASSLSWQPRTPDAWGALAFGPDMRQPHHAALAMTVVYAPEERIATLMVGGHDRLRVWLNGRLVHEIPVPVTWAGGLDCVPVVLRRGRNTVLVEATHEAGPEAVLVRLGDSPLDRAYQFTRLGLWRESISHWDEWRARHPEQVITPFFCGLPLLLAGDVARYSDLSRQFVRRAETTLSDGLFVRLAARNANLYPYDSGDAGVVVRCVETLEARSPAVDWWSPAASAMAYYRVGKYAEQLRWLKPHEDSYCFQLWLALGYHQLGQPDEAKRRLQLADEGFMNEIVQAKSGRSYRYVQGGQGWYEPDEFIIYRREAAQLIEGQTEAFDKLVADYVEEGRRELARRTPELAAYDETVAYHHGLPRAWRARARRLIELGRWDEATRDLDHALTLNNDDPRTWIAYAEYWLARGNADEMARSVLQAVNNLAADPSELTQQELASLLGRLDGAIVTSAEPGTRTQLLIVLARHAADGGKIPEAEQYYQQALDADAQNSRAWIARGRFFAERGEQDKADADFAKAASLTPNELGKFLEAGWWVVGPYPAEPEECCPPEVDPDPSVPVHIVDPRTGLSDEPVKWESVPTGKRGLIQLTNLSAPKDGASVYALAYVHSPEERSIALIFNSSALPVQVWVNGQGLEPPIPDGIPQLGVHQAPCHLRTGTNAILVKLRADNAPEITLSDAAQNPLELLAFGLYRQGAEAIAQAMPQGPGATDWGILAQGAQAALCVRNYDLYRQFLERVYDRIDAQDPSINDPLAFEILWCAPEGIVDWQRVPSSLGTGDALKHYRLGEWQAALDEWTATSAQNSGWWWPFLAMAHHKLGHEADAEHWLTRAKSHFDLRLSNFTGSGLEGLWDFYPRFREAVELIEGDTTALDARFDTFLAERKRLWDARDPLTFAFDQAVNDSLANESGRTWGYDGVARSSRDPHAYLARGRRLAELSRWDAAEADFNKAVELTPGNWEVLLARASFLARRGQLTAAAEAFENLLAKTDGDQLGPERHVVEQEIAGNKPLLDELQSRRPGAAIFARLRSQQEARMGRWNEAAAVLGTGEPHWSHCGLLGALHCLLGDYAAHARDCEEMDRLIEQQQPGDPNAPIHRCSVRSLHVADPAEAAAILKLAQQAQREYPDAHDARLNLALAYYRAGYYEVAQRCAYDSLAAAAPWQEHAVAWPVLAMCHWQLGDHDEARRFLRKAAWWVDFTRRAATHPGSAGPSSIDDCEWLRTHALYQEAQSLISAGPPISSPNEPPDAATR